MKELSELLRPSWEIDRWIAEGWSQLTETEKQRIQIRMDGVFKQGLPFEIKQDKLLYVYAFSLLAQLEIIALQMPLKIHDAALPSDYQNKTHLQLVEGVFRAMVFTRVVYLLSAPYATPPATNHNFDGLCHFIRIETSPVVSMALYKLIAEGWIDEIMLGLERQGIVIHGFEPRAKFEVDLLHRDFAQFDGGLICNKLVQIEDQFLTSVLMQYKYLFSLSMLLGVDGTIYFLKSLHQNHLQQLAILNLKPTDRWFMFMGVIDTFIPKMMSYGAVKDPIEFTPIRKIFMAVWDNPTDPTMVAEFNLNVSSIDFFNKKFPPETVTILMMQSISLALTGMDSFRSYLNQKKLYQTKEAYVALVVKLPGCGDHIANIVFENCHLISMATLSVKIQAVIKMMVYCYKKREFLENTYPHLKANTEQFLNEWANDVYDFPFPGNGVVSLSNIGFCGFSGAKSPLFPNEALKFTLLEIERKPVWNKQTDAFEPQDMLPVSISADHRVFDGNVPVPKLIASCFETMLVSLQANTATAAASAEANQPNDLIAILDGLVDGNVEIAYKALLVLQTYWMDYLGIDVFLKNRFATLFNDACAEGA